ncbi:MAG: hypothetical protein JO263_04970 [Candidatus Eremiobacteraeota bacterium]|nr:hypothetical protein [Candidatus Eremiobacteraeota bacterium]
MKQSAPPRCYILDDRYRLILACRPSPDDPLNRFYHVDTPADTLPAEIENAVRSMTSAWERYGDPAVGATIVCGMRITVAPLHGSAGPHVAVFVDAA